MLACPEPKAGALLKWSRDWARLTDLKATLLAVLCYFPETGVVSLTDVVDIDTFLSRAGSG